MRILFLLCGAIALAALAFVLLRGADAPSGVDTPGPRNAAPEDARAPDLRAPREAPPARQEVEPAEEPPPSELSADFELPEEEFEEEFEELPDPVETGDCTLFLSLVEAATFHPVESGVYLWRLDAPENDNWARGDQLQTSLHVPKSGAFVYELPAGRYRARCGREVHGRDDPPAFLVEGSRTNVTLEIVLPIAHPVYLRIFDETGLEIREAHGGMRAHSLRTRSPGDPAWRTPRRPRVAGFMDIEWEEEIGFAFTTHPWPPQRAGLHGFHLGDIHGGDRESVTTRHVQLRVDGKSEVCFYRIDEAHGPVHLVSVVVDRERLLEGVLLPDGTSAAELGEALRIEAEYVNGGDDAEPEPWRDVPIHIRLRGHATLADFSFTYCLADGPPPVQYLQERTATDD